MNKKIIFGIIIIVIDLLVYLLLGLLLMNYEDFYDDSKGEYWSLASMTTSQKITYICYNLWILLNIALIVYIIGRKIIKRK
jgi:hypothetical protein